jgi:ABC-2 type transport system ATP-binding protein
MMLDISHVHKSFGVRRVLQDLDLHVAAGEVYGLLGPNGAGKSTTFALICNLLLPDSGEIRIAGKLAHEASRSTLGVVAQQVALYQNLSCAENLAFFAHCYGLSGAAARTRTAACLDSVGLTERRNSVVRDLSGGMQRRLHVAVALVHSPRLVILDEPSTGLDVESRRDQWALIRRLKQANLTVLLATHLLDEAEALCDRIGIIRNGRLRAEGTPEALRARIAATEIAILQSPAPDQAQAIARSRGFETRTLEHGLAVWLPKRMELRELLATFDGIPLDSIARRPVSLEDAYVELSQSDEAK